MQLGVMWSHDCAIITDKLFATVTEVSKRLLVHHTVLLSIQGSMSAKGELVLVTSSGVEDTSHIIGCKGLTERNIVQVCSSKNIDVLALLHAALHVFHINLRRSNVKVIFLFFALGTLGILILLAW